MDFWISTIIKLSLVAAGITVGYIRESKLTEANRIFWLFLVVSGGGEILEWLMAYYLKNNFPFYHVFRPLFYGLLTYAMTIELGKLKKIFRLSIPVIWIAAYLNGKYFQQPNLHLNTVIISLTCLLQILQVLFYIAMLFDKYNWHQTLYHYSFWIAMGILIHSIISFLTLGIHNFLETDGQKAVISFLIISEWIFYASFVVNLLVQKRQPES